MFYYLLPWGHMVIDWLIDWYIQVQKVSKMKTYMYFLTQVHLKVPAFYGTFNPIILWKE